MKNGQADGRAVTRLLVINLVLATVLFSGCGERAREGQLQKAEITKDDIDDAIVLEKAVDANAKIPAPAGTPWFVVMKGTIPVIVTAGHATQPMREGKPRFSDGGGTAALANLLHKKTGCTVIYTQYASPSDPNFYDDNEFKKELSVLIGSIKPRVVLDLHGSHAYRPYDIDIGTMNGESLLNRPEYQTLLVESLKVEGILNFSSNFFSAASNATITKFSKELGAPALQLEISGTWVASSQGELFAHRFSQLAQGLCRYIRQVSQ